MTLGRHLLPILLAANLLSVSGPSASIPADPPREIQAYAERLKSHTVQVSGSENPEQIPYLVKMDAFFRQCGADRSCVENLQLNKGDREALTALVAQEEGHRDRATHVLEQEMARMCEEIAGKEAEEIDGFGRTARWDQLAKERDQARTSRYVTLMNSLSKEGSRSIQDYAENEILPNLSWGTIDAVALAAEFPKQAADRFIRLCSDEPAPRPVISSSGYSADASGPHKRALTVALNRTEQDHRADGGLLH